MWMREGCRMKMTMYTYEAAAENDRKFRFKFGG